MTAVPSERLQSERPKPTAGWSRRVTPLVFLGLSLPTFAQLRSGDLSLDAAAMRCLIALAVAVVAMQLLESIVRGYTIEPEPAPEIVAEVEAAPEPPPTRRADDAPLPS